MILLAWSRAANLITIRSGRRGTDIRLFTIRRGRIDPGLTPGTIRIDLIPTSVEEREKVSIPDSTKSPWWEEERLVVPDQHSGWPRRHGLGLSYPAGRLQLHFQLFSIAVVVVVNFLPWQRNSMKMQSYDKQMQWRRAAQLKVRETENFWSDCRQCTKSNHDIT
jgi:hypothetical protein